LLAETTVKDIN